MEKLPFGWEKAAREQGAIQRSLRKFEGPEGLLLSIFWVITQGLTLRLCTTLLSGMKGRKPSHVAVHLRMKEAGNWLTWMVNGATDQVRATLRNTSRRRIRLVDGTVIRHKASESAFRVFAAFDLETMRPDFLELTDIARGESFSRLDVQEGEIFIGDRGLARPSGIGHLVSLGGDVLVRMPTNIPIFKPNGESLNWVDVLAQVTQPSQSKEVAVCLKDKERDRLIPGRLVVFKKDAAAMGRELANQMENARKQGRKLEPLSVYGTNFVILWTTLPPEEYTTQEVSLLYRQRWQIELFFKRLKSLMSLEDIPAMLPSTALTWIAARLLLAVCTEDFAGQAKTFFPTQNQEPISA